MIITEQVVLERMEAIALDKENVVAQLHALNGAMQDCQFWLAQLARVEIPKDVPEQPSGE